MPNLQIGKIQQIQTAIDNFIKWAETMSMRSGQHDLHYHRWHSNQKRCSNQQFKNSHATLEYVDTTINFVLTLKSAQNLRHFYHWAYSGNDNHCSQRQVVIFMIYKILVNTGTKFSIISPTLENTDKHNSTKNPRNSFSLSFNIYQFCTTIFFVKFFINSLGLQPAKYNHSINKPTDSYFMETQPGKIQNCQS